jgi:hypothetical protein
MSPAAPLEIPDVCRPPFQPSAPKPATATLTRAVDSIGLASAGLARLATAQLPKV